jgi:hypothetical protein
LRAEDAASSAPPNPPLPPQPNAAELKRIEALIGQLNADSFAEREQAEAGLLKLGDVVIPPLHAALKQDPTPEARLRVGRVLADLEAEVWEGYFFHSAEKFEAAMQAHAPRSRFAVKIKDRGQKLVLEYSADPAYVTVTGFYDFMCGGMFFNIQTRDEARLKFSGRQNLTSKRIEGQYAPDHDGLAPLIRFVLFQRKLTDAERKQFDPPEKPKP